ncbi:small integral membrane protein 20-like [Arctopsyche grandis]|uniref:small integral membrane protein 20-like n=1 Tax=Arctopsyche grandis TaxID=121162 RepID=UPI00406D7AA1
MSLKRFGIYIGFVGAVVAAMYPIAISPMIDPTYYKDLQKITRKDVIQENIQPGNMKVWSDPFDRKKSDK